MSAPTRKAQEPKAIARAGLKPARQDPRTSKLAEARAAYREAREQRAAMAQILRIIAKSPADTDAVFASITRAAARLIPESRSALFLVRDGMIHYASHTGITETRRSRMEKLYPAPLNRELLAGVCILDKRVVHLPDVRDAGKKYPRAVAMSRISGYRAILQVPLISAGKAIGALAVSRASVGAFTGTQVALVESFADQAVIAIENARLFNETKESLEQQTASSEVLGVISSSPTDLKPVFEAILKSALRLCDAHLGLLNLWKGTTFRTVAQQGAESAFAKWLFARGDVRPVKFSTPMKMYREKRSIQSDDLRKSKAYGDGSPTAIKFVEEGKARTYLTVPMLKDGELIGAIVIYRSEVRPFTDRQITLVETFARQAVIAIENVRLFSELQNTNSNLRKALEQQTATGEILKVISESTTNVQPVFQTIASNARQLLGGSSCGVILIDQGQARMAAIATLPGAEDYSSAQKAYPMPFAEFERKRPQFAQMMKERSTASWSDTELEFTGELLAFCRAAGIRSNVAVSMLRGDDAIGLIVVNRGQPHVTSPDEVRLLQSFASQAVIAIENTRLFNETKEALEQQTASGDILKVISTSTTDTQPVFDAIVRSAQRLLSAKSAILLLRRETDCVVVGNSARALEELPAQVRTLPLDREKNFPSRVILDGEVLHIPDWDGDDIIEHERFVAKSYGIGSGIQVPLIRLGQGIGALVITRAAKGPFHDKEIALLSSFADQAVIAIENVRLFNETKEALDRQTATADVLAAISGAQTDVGPVFDAIARNVHRLCGAMFCNVLRCDGDLVHMAASHGFSPDQRVKLAEKYPVKVDDPSVISTRVIRRRVVEYIDDVLADPEYDKAHAATAGWRRMLGVPMLRDGVPIGGIVGAWRDPGKTPQHHVELLQTFAAQAVIAIENVRLFNETKEALEQQTASSDILRVISSSPNDIQPVFDAVLERALALCDANHGSLFQLEGALLRRVATRGVGHSSPVGGFLPLESGPGRAVRDGRTIHLEDVQSELTWHAPEVAENLRRQGIRTVLAAPLLREQNAIGAILIRRTEVRPFSAKQIRLLETFAAQAVIAIENVRLFNETKEALEQQTATAEILKVISSSPTDEQPVFDAIVKSADRLFERMARIRLLGDGQLHLRAFSRPRPGGDLPLAMTPDSIGGRVAHARRALQIADVLAPGTPTGNIDRGRQVGYRAIAAAPLMRDDTLVGVLSVSAPEPGALSDKQMALLQTFADQAVIAIENVRLFRELQTRNKDLTEALEQQTATGEILNVISRSQTDVKPVFETIIRNAVRLGGGAFGGIFGYDGKMADIVATHNVPSAVDEMYRNSFPRPAGEDNPACAAILRRAVVNVPDIDQSSYSADTKQRAHAIGYRSILNVPLMRGEDPIGCISVGRPQPGPYSDAYIALLKTFADQAVIAIENVRLFREIEARNKELTTALDQQTATSDILRVISRSTKDVQPVFEAIADSAQRLTKGWSAIIWRLEDRRLRPIAFSGGLPGSNDVVRNVLATSLAVDDIPFVVEALATGKPKQLLDSEDEAIPALVREAARVRGWRSNVAVPMLQGGTPIGLISLSRKEPGGFNPQEIALLVTFADQAVIAIENVRLFKELESRTEALSKSVGQLTALGEVGRAVSSTLDLDTVLKTIVSRAVQLTGLDAGVIYEYSEAEDRYNVRAWENLDDVAIAQLRATSIRHGEGAIGKSVATRESVQVPDTHSADYPARLRELLDAFGYRAILAVPLLQESRIAGALMMIRKAPGAFAPEVVELLKTFGTQSAMAIQNARLYREIAEKGRQLETASQHKSQFLASMSHELRTPLNAILGFNEMLIGGIYGDVPGEMQEPLKDIQTSGKHLLRLINNVLDLAKIEAGRMELALGEYSVHDTIAGVQATLRPLAAEKGLDFVASVPDDIPPAYGDAGRLTQCLVNLAGNSLKFTKQGKVEIAVARENGTLRYSVSDTGIGIPPDKIGSLFTEFKQTDATIASEYGGTGLGLSITKKFIEMHGGRIWVESELGRGSSFIFEIPLRAEP